MPDEASTPPADVQAPPSEPVSAPVIEPTPPPEAVAPAPEPESLSQNETETGTPTPTETLVSTEAQASVGEPVPEPTPVQQSNPQPRPQTTTSTPVPALHGDIAKARAAMQDQKRRKLDKIMAKLTEKGKITNDEVEKLLHVSDATATRYLQALEKENKIKQTGKTGIGVFYEKI